MTDSLVSGSTALSRNKAVTRPLRYARPACVMPGWTGHLTPEALSRNLASGAHLSRTPAKPNVPQRALQQGLTVSGVSPNRTPAPQTGLFDPGVRSATLRISHLRRFSAFSTLVRTCAAYLRHRMCLTEPCSWV